MEHLRSVLKSWDQLIHQEAFSRSRLIKKINEFNKELLSRFQLPKYYNATQFCFSTQQGSLRELREEYFRKIHIIAQTVQKSKKTIAESVLAKIPKKANIFVLDDANIKHILSEARKSKKVTIHSITKLKTPSIKYGGPQLRQALKKCDLVLLNAVAVTKSRIIDVVGAELVAHVARSLNIPVYVVTSVFNADFSNVFLGNLEKGNTYELVDPSLVTGIISEIGIYDHHIFLEQAKKTLTP